MDIYQLNIMEHYKNPRNKGACEQATFTSDVVNPSCGDSIVMTGIVADGKLVSVCFNGYGCVISQAAASMLTEKVMGIQITDILLFTAEDMIALVGIQLGPTRARCALLALEALHKGIAPDA